jgi:Transposase, Mutator family
VVQQAYVCGVSTRRVDQLVESLGLRVSRSEVSRICAGLDEQVEAFRTRPLEGRYLYLFLDAKVEKVRDGGRVQRKCVVIAHGVHETGRREIIGLDVGQAETEAFWTEFLRELVARGLVGVQLVISDAHEGLKNAIARVLGAPWQRCTVHFLRDCLGHARRDQHGLLAALIRPSSASSMARRPTAEFAVAGARTCALKGWIHQQRGRTTTAAGARHARSLRFRCFWGPCGRGLERGESRDGCSGDARLRADEAACSAATSVCPAPRIRPTWPRSRAQRPQVQSAIRRSDRGRCVLYRRSPASRDCAARQVRAPRPTVTAPLPRLHQAR